MMLVRVCVCLCAGGVGGEREVRLMAGRWTPWQLALSNLSDVTGGGKSTGVHPDRARKQSQVVVLRPA